jgi:hypothetical protein
LILLTADRRASGLKAFPDSQRPGILQRRTMVPKVSLTFLNRRTNRQICRVCHELAELKTEHLCAVCTHIKSQISLRFAAAVGGTVSIPAQQQCKRAGCSCAACDRRTLDVHPLYVFDLARADRREVHLHPRCHDLWLEAVKGPNSGQEHAIDVAQG